MQLKSEPTFRILYDNIHATYPANFIETNYIVQQIQQFKR